MLARKRLVYNTALLTGSSLLMNLIGMAFQAWLAGRIGSAGIGLYQLVCSVTMLCATFAISGIRFASTRLISEEIGSLKPGGIGTALRRCMAYAALFGFAAAALLYLMAEPIGFLWVGDARTVLSIRIAAFGMPCVSLCAAMSGYFTACGRIWKPTAVHLIEQLIGIAAVAWLLNRAPAGDIEKSCAAVTLGRLAADILSLILMFFACLHDRRRHYGAASASGRITARMLSIALPLAVSAYARSALSTFQHLLVPRGLKAAGYSANSALSGYGIIQGMVMPIIFFPACIMGAAAELIVPELTEAQMQGSDGRIRSIVHGLLRNSLLFSVAVGGFMFLTADMLGFAIYKSAAAGRYIRLLAPLIPIIYTDISIDGCLKGLGLQVWSMGINILDSLLGLLLVWTILPRYALAGYVFIIYFGEILNFVLSLRRLRRYLQGRGTGAAKSQVQRQ